MKTLRAIRNTRDLIVCFRRMELSKVNIKNGMSAAIVRNMDE